MTLTSLSLPREARRASTMVSVNMRGDASAGELVEVAQRLGNKHVDIVFEAPTESGEEKGQHWNREVGQR